MSHAGVDLSTAAYEADTLQTKLPRPCFPILFIFIFRIQVRNPILECYFDHGEVRTRQSYNHTKNGTHKILTCFSMVIILSRCLLIKLQPRNLSRGDKGIYKLSCCSMQGLRRVSNASWDSRVGMAAAQARWGRILDGGLITEK